MRQPFAGYFFFLTLDLQLRRLECSARPPCGVKVIRALTFTLPVCRSLLLGAPW